MKKKIDYNYILLGVFSLFLIGIIVGTDFLFGSKTDWINQHTVFPDYFRTLFYQTGKLIPSFAAQIGAGQNIFSFSYYGFLNPIILISYLLPMIPMVDYMIAANIILILSTIFLLYYFLKQHTNNSSCCFLSTILILLSASFLFQFHRHFMFVSYMPFLILGFIGIDAYFKKGTRWIYTLATFLMIMTSYYYSIIGIFLFVLYGIYHYIKNTNKISIKTFFQVGIPFLIPILIGILMAGILLVPTIYVILLSRGKEQMAFTLKELLLPKANINAIVYDTYALGLTSIFFIACIYLLQKKVVELRFLIITTILIMIFPICIYLLNGTLYIRNKVFIPFIPFFALFLSQFLKDLLEKKVLISSLIRVLLIVSFICFLMGYHNLLFYLDLLVMIISIIFYSKWNYKWIIIVPTITISLINFSCSIKQMNLVSKEFYNEVFSKEKEALIKQTLKKEDQIVRFSNLDDTLYTINKIYDPYYYQTSLYSSTYHNDYNNFVKQTFKNALPFRNELILAQTDNIMFETFMGVKYLLSSYTPSIGYEEIITGNENKNLKIYENKNVLSFGFATANILEEKYFDTLSYSVTNEALLSNIVVSNKGSNSFNSKTQTFLKKARVLEKDDTVSIKKTDKGYIVDAKENSSIKITFDHDFNEEILFLQFHLKNQNSCKNGDQKITINQMTNKLTCKEWEYQNNNHIFHYVLSQNKNWKELTISFKKGHYEIEDIKMNTINYNEIIKNISEFDQFVIDKKETKGDYIKGEITIKKDGYFATTIPYDKGFTVKVDGKKIKYEKVNKAFLGFPIKEGKHQIEIIYHSPFLNIGYLITMIGILSFGIIVYKDCKNCKK